MQILESILIILGTPVFVFLIYFLVLFVRSPGDIIDGFRRGVRRGHADEQRKLHPERIELKEGGAALLPLQADVIQSLGWTEEHDFVTVVKEHEQYGRYLVVLRPGPGQTCADLIILFEEQN